MQQTTYCIEQENLYKTNLSEQIFGEKVIVDEQTLMTQNNNYKCRLFEEGISNKLESEEVKSSPDKQKRRMPERVRIPILRNYHLEE